MMSLELPRNATVCLTCEAEFADYLCVDGCGAACAGCFEGMHPADDVELSSHDAVAIDGRVPSSARDA